MIKKAYHYQTWHFVNIFNNLFQFYLLQKISRMFFLKVVCNASIEGVNVVVALSLIDLNEKEINFTKTKKPPDILPPIYTLKYWFF